MTPENVQKTGRFFKAFRDIVLRHFGTSDNVPSEAELERKIPMVIKDLQWN